MARYQHGRTAEDTRLPQVVVETGIEVVRSEEYPEHVSGAFYISGVKLEGSHSIESPDKTLTGYCFGQSRKVFWITIGFLFLVVVAAIAGGVAGGLVHQSSSGKRPMDTIPPEGSNTPASGAFIDSQLAAVNWTDGAGQLRRAVFYQSAGNLLASVTQGSGSAETWTQVNISAQFEQDTDWVAARTGTPLAASAIPWQGLEHHSFSVVLFYLDGNNLVRQLRSRDYDLREWIRGTEWDSASVHAAAEGSRLSSVTYYCPQGCLNYMCVTYQDADRQVWFASGNDWNNRTPIVKPYPGTPLAIIPFTADNVTRVKVDELRFFYYSDTDIKSYLFNFKDSGIFLFDDWEIIMQSLESSSSPGPLPQVVAAPYQSVSKIMVLAMDGNGKIIESWWDGKWNINKPVFFVNEDELVTQGMSKTNMSAIALDHDHCLYGVAVDGSKITQFTWSPDSTLWFNWTSIVVSG
ncbi:hypothetical protein F4824DRAFT_513980 [Ustulina deusta]|nr:hypothetical protein F4824DRAFT_513980 [Ustulina deusta]